MEKEQKVISQPLAKKIHVKAKENRFELPKSEKKWVNVPTSVDGKYTEWQLWNTDSYSSCINKSYPAFDCAELREMIGKKMIETYMNAGKVSVMIYGHPQFDEDTFVEAMGKMFYYLLDNNLL